MTRAPTGNPDSPYDDDEDEADEPVLLATRIVDEITERYEYLSVDQATDVVTATLGILQEWQLLGDDIA